MEKKSWELSEEQKKHVQAKNTMIVNDTAKLMLYNEYVESQRKRFYCSYEFCYKQIKRINC